MLDVGLVSDERGGDLKDCAIKGVGKWSECAREYSIDTGKNCSTK